MNKNPDKKKLSKWKAMASAQPDKYAPVSWPHRLPFKRSKNGFRDIYSGGFYPFDTLEEHRAYWSRYIYINRYLDTPKPVYKDFLKLVQHKDDFVLTANVDHCFQTDGFDKQRLFYTQGDYGLWQCSRPCRQKAYENEMVIKNVNLRADDSFVEDEGWHEAARRYENFLRSHEGQHILFLELGVGGNTPAIIKYPFWKMTYQNPKAIYACINLSEAYCPRELQKQAICIDGDVGKILTSLL